MVDPAKDIRTFRVASTGSLGSKRGRGRGAFIDSVLSSVVGSFGDVLGSLRAWSAAPPKLRPVHAEPPEVDDTVPAALASTDYSSQDGTEPAAAVEPGSEDPTDRAGALAVDHMDNAPRGAIAGA